MTMRESTTAVCRHCGERFPLKPRAGRNTGRGSRRTITTYAPARYCSNAHRVAASRARFSRNSTPTNPAADAIKPLAGTYAPSAVTAPLQHIELSREITTPKTTLDPRIVPDAKWPGMYRIKLPGGGLSDLINLTRARDALRQLF